MDVLKYAWLSDWAFPLAQAGCITVVPGAELESLAGAFGAEQTATFDDPPPIGDYATFRSCVGNAVLAIENNGYQGTRSVVLARASKSGSGGKAASICWDVDGVISFSCARSGRLVASVELGFADDYGHLPKALQALATQTEHAGADLFAIGGAMLEAYTGVGLVRDDVAAPFSWFRLEPPADLLPEVTTESASLQFWSEHRHDSQMRQVLLGVAEIDPLAQRRLASWVATVALEHASLVPLKAVYEELLAVLLSDSKIAPSRRLSSHMERVERAWRAGHMALSVSSGRWFPLRSLDRLGEVHYLNLAVRYACHPDPRTAAWEAVFNAGQSLDLGVRLTISSARDAFYPAVLAYLQSPETTWTEFESMFPRRVVTNVRQERLDDEQATYLRERRHWDEVWGPQEDAGPIRPFDLPE